MFKLVLEKAEEQEIKLPTSAGSWKKQESSRKTSVCEVAQSCPTLGNPWTVALGFPSGSVVKNPPANTGDAGSIPGSGISPGEGNGDPLQYSCLENPMDRGAWWAIVHGIAESQTQLGDQARVTRFFTS